MPEFYAVRMDAEGNPYPLDDPRADRRDIPDFTHKAPAWTAAARLREDGWVLLEVLIPAQPPVTRIVPTDDYSTIEYSWFE